MTREELVKAVWEEQHRQHGLVRRKHHGGKGSHGEHDRPPHAPDHRPPARQEHLLHKMEENGLIVRRKDPSDGRAILVDLTPAGEAAEQAHHEKVMKEVEARYVALTDEELAEYLRLTQKINETLETEQQAE